MVIDNYCLNRWRVRCERLESLNAGFLSPTIKKIKKLAVYLRAPLQMLSKDDIGGAV